MFISKLHTMVMARLFNFNFSIFLSLDAFILKPAEGIAKKVFVIYNQRDFIQDKPFKSNFQSPFDKDDSDTVNFTIYLQNFTANLQTIFNRTIENERCDRG